MVRSISKTRMLSLAWVAHSCGLSNILHQIRVDLRIEFEIRHNGMAADASFLF